MLRVRVAFWCDLCLKPFRVVLVSGESDICKYVVSFGLMWLIGWTIQVALVAECMTWFRKMHAKEVIQESWRLTGIVIALFLCGEERGHKRERKTAGKEKHQTGKEKHHTPFFAQWVMGVLSINHPQTTCSNTSGLLFKEKFIISLLTFLLRECLDFAHMSSLHRRERRFKKNCWVAEFTAGLDRFRLHQTSLTASVVRLHQTMSVKLHQSLICAQLGLGTCGSCSSLSIHFDQLNVCTV